MTRLEDKVNPNGDENNENDLHQVTAPTILTNSPVSREEHLASLDSLKSSMRLEIAAMFEQYLGKKPSGATDQSTAPSVDLTMAEVKPSNNGSTSAENIVPFLREMVVLVRVLLFHHRISNLPLWSTILCVTSITWDLLLSLILAIAKWQ
jgi:hypothetical protein